MSEIILKTEDLCYAYFDEELALKHINIEIREKEKIAVVGSNGAGKSTFFLNLNGVFRPESGHIYYRGQKISGRKEDLNLLRKGVGIVFQDADNQIVASTVMGEVSFGPMNLKLPKDEVIRRVDDALAYMNLTDFKERPPHYLSGGEKKRVSIADIIAMESEVVVFDEPTAALDPLNVEMLEDVLARLADQGKTLMISTHDVNFAYRWADRVLVFHRGEIVADGTPKEIFTQSDLLAETHLRKPMMLEFYEYLVEAGLEPGGRYPRTMEELKTGF